VARTFRLVRDEDATGVSGTGTVAEGAEFSDGTVALRWTSTFPTSVVFHDRGMDSVVAVHGHGGKTRIVWDDDGTEHDQGHLIAEHDVDWESILTGDPAAPHVVTAYHRALQIGVRGKGSSERLARADAMRGLRAAAAALHG